MRSHTNHMNSVEQKLVFLLSQILLIYDISYDLMVGHAKSQTVYNKCMEQVTAYALMPLTI